jgi:carbon-monoxide dehydrogenase medium subunit
VAGGHSLLPMMKLRLATPEHLIDINPLAAELGYIREEGGDIRIGSMTRHREVLESDLLAERFPIFREAEKLIADPPVRNRGTVGGAVAHADPGSDLPAVLIALDASFVLRSRAAGERVVPADGFFQGAFETLIEPTEILTEVRIPALPPGAGTAYEMLSQMASGYALVGAAAVVSRQDGTLGHVRVGITGVVDAAYRATSVEEALTGKELTPEGIASAAARAAEGRVVNSDIHADEEYRRAMAGVYVRRAIEAALDRSS